jgi:hypothetical protein
MTGAPVGDLLGLVLGEEVVGVFDGGREGPVLGGADGNLLGLVVGWEVVGVFDGS